MSLYLLSSYFNCAFMLFQKINVTKSKLNNETWMYPEGIIGKTVKQRGQKCTNKYSLFN